jgi:hypothetical protein
MAAFVAPALLALSTLAISPVQAQDTRGTETLTEDDVITGSMDITFNTRSSKDNSGDLREGSAAVGAKDIYKFNTKVAKTTEFSGEVSRVPNLYTRLLQKKRQEASLTYSVDLAVLSKDLKQRKVVGKWVGQVPVDPTSGAFELGGGAKDERPLRIQVDATGRAPAFEERFAGRLIGKAETKSNLAQYTFKRLVGNKTVEVVVKQSDPMRFENIRLAKGPAEIYPTTSVNGRLDYDYETGNWLTDGIRFRYTLDGKEYEDLVTGTIKWIEDPDRASNGKGYYEFNLRFNEASNKQPTSENDAFEKMSDEDAFFAVDTSIPCLTGRISYADTMNGETVISSKVEYRLNANKLSKQQIMNFFKLWMLCVGPTNDE